MSPDVSWQARSLCAGMDPDEIEAVFFPHPNDNANEAKAICRVCPVASECLTYAIETGQEFGVWGAMTEQERRLKFRLKRPSGLPAARCGTESGYRRHLRAKEQTCEQCKTANNLARRAREEAAS